MLTVFLCVPIEALDAIHTPENALYFSDHILPPGTWTILFSPFYTVQRHDHLLQHHLKEHPMPVNELTNCRWQIIDGLFV